MTQRVSCLNEVDLKQEATEHVEQDRRLGHGAHEVIEHVPLLSIKAKQRKKSLT